MEKSKLNKELTEKQEKLLKFIEEYQIENNKSPTIREMREFFGVSSDNSILKLLKALEEKNVIEKDESHRGIKTLNSVKKKLARESFKLPLMGFIPAGGPILTEEFVDSWMEVSPDLIQKNKNSYLLRVTGESMINAGIFDGDILIVCSDFIPKNGDIVVALVDNQNTVKRYIKTDELVYLKAENPRYEDIYPEHHLEIQGVVTGLLRFYK